MIHEINGDKIRRLRTNKGWTRGKVAGQLRVTKQIVAEYESKIALLTKEQLLDVCILFGVKPKDLVVSGKELEQRQLELEQRNLKLEQRRLELEQKRINAEQSITNSSDSAPKKKRKKRKKHKPKSISRKLIISTGFETNRRRH